MDKRTLIIIGAVALVLMLARPAFAIKSGATVSARPEIIKARSIIASVWRSFGYTLTVTSGIDSTHSQDSLHYQGLAEDYRIKDVSPSALYGMIAQVKTLLGPS